MEIQIVLVFETSRLKRTDDAYYQWMLKSYFPKEMSRDDGSDLHIIFHYAYMDGKTNYKRKSTLEQIRSFKAYSGRTHVVYCFDVDTKTKADLEFIEEASSWCQDNGYLVSLAMPEIETVFGYGADKGDKVCRMRLFAQHYPKKEKIAKADLFLPFNISPSVLSYGQTNFCSLIQSIIDEYKR